MLKVLAKWTIFWMFFIKDTNSVVGFDQSKSMEQENGNILLSLIYEMPLRASATQTKHSYPQRIQSVGARDSKKRPTNLADENLVYETSEPEDIKPSNEKDYHHTTYSNFSTPLNKSGQVDYTRKIDESEVNVGNYLKATHCRRELLKYSETYKRHLKRCESDKETKSLLPYCFGRCIYLGNGFIGLENKLVPEEVEIHLGNLYEFSEVLKKKVIENFRSCLPKWRASSICLDNQMYFQCMATFFNGVCSNLGRGLFSWVSKATSSAKHAVSKATNVVSTNVASTANKAASVTANTAKTGIDSTKSVVSKVASTGTDIVNSGVDVTKNTTNNLVSAGTDIVNTGLNVTTSAVDSAVLTGANIVNNATNITDAVISNGTSIVNSGVDMTKTSVDNAISTGTNILNSGVNMTQTAVDSAISTGTNILNSGVNMTQTAVNSATSTGTDIVNSTTIAVDNIVSSGTNIVNSGVDMTKNAVSTTKDIVNKGMDITSSVANNVIDTGTSVIKSGISSVNQLTSSGKDILNRGMEVTNGAANIVASTGENLANGGGDLANGEKATVDPSDLPNNEDETLAEDDISDTNVTETISTVSKESSLEPTKNMDSSSGSKNLKSKVNNNSKLQPPSSKVINEEAKNDVLLMQQQVIGRLIKTTNKTPDQYGLYGEMLALKFREISKKDHKTFLTLQKEINNLVNHSEFDLL